MKTFKTIVTFKNGNTGIQLASVDVIYALETGVILAGDVTKAVTMTIDEYLKYSEYIEKKASPSEAKKVANYRKQIEVLMKCTNQMVSGGLRIVK